MASLAWKFLIAEAETTELSAKDGRLASRIPENSKSCCELLEDCIVSWLDGHALSDCKQDNALAHKSKFSSNWLDKHDIENDMLILLPSNSPDLSPIKNSCAIIKRRVYRNLRQYTSLGRPIGDECEVIWTNSPIFKVPRLQEANCFTQPNLT